MAGDRNEERRNVCPVDNTVWLTQKLMAELFQKDVRTINEHIQNILRRMSWFLNQLSGNFGQLPLTANHRIRCTSTS
jgi:hypothetical protein